MACPDWTEAFYLAGCVGLYKYYVYLLVVSCGGGNSSSSSISISFLPLFGTMTTSLSVLSIVPGCCCRLLLLLLLLLSLVVLVVLVVLLILLLELEFCNTNVVAALLPTSSTAYSKSSIVTTQSNIATASCRPLLSFLFASRSTEYNETARSRALR